MAETDIATQEDAARPAVRSETWLGDWPKTERGRYLCTAERPRPKDSTGRWEHTNANEVGAQEDGYPGGDIITVRCADCGFQWREELPQ